MPDGILGQAAACNCARLKLLQDGHICCALAKSASSPAIDVQATEGKRTRAEYARERKQKTRRAKI